MKISRRMLREGLAVFAFLSGFIALPAAAATYTVNATTDSGSGSGTTGDLRYALTHASGGDTIVFSLASNSTITLTSALPVINNNITIDGSGATGLAISGADAYQIFQVSTVGAGSGPTVLIENIKLTHGLAQGGNGGVGGGLGQNGAGGGGGLGAGGAVLALDHSSVTLTNVALDSNQAKGGNGGTTLGQGSTNIGGAGGGFNGGASASGGNSGSSGANGNFGQGAGGGGRNGVGGAGGFGAGGGGGGGGGGFSGGGSGGTSAGNGGWGTAGSMGGAGGGGAGLGAAVFADSSATVTINNSTIGTNSSNTVTGGFGGSANPPSALNGGNGSGAGAAVYTQNGATFGGGTISNDIAGSGGVTVTGSASTLETFNTANSYTGGTTVFGATLAIADDNRLGDSSGGVILTGGKLRALVDLSSARNIVLQSFGNIDTNTHAVTLGGVISGGGELMVSDNVFGGGGILTLTATNTYQGGTLVYDGNTLIISRDNNLGDASGGVGLQHGTLRLNAGINTARSVTLNTAGTIDLYGSTSTFSGVIGGVGILTVSSSAGSGALNLTATNSYTGGTIVTSGATVVIGNDNNLGNSSGDLTLNQGTLQVTATVSTSRNIHIVTSGVLSASSYDLTANGAIDGGALYIYNGTGTVVLNHQNTYTGGTSISQAVLSISNDNQLGSASATAFGGYTNIFIQQATLRTTADINTSRAIYIANGDFGTGRAATIDTYGNSSTFSGVIGGYGWLTVSSSTGSGTLNLTNTNTYAGGTIINSGATVAIRNDNNLGNSTGAITLNGGTLETTATLETSRAIYINSNGTLRANVGTLTVNGTIDGGELDILSGTGVVVLNHQNTYTGGTGIVQSTLAITNDNQLGNASATAFQGIANILISNGTLLTAADIATSRTFDLLGASSGIIDTYGHTSTFSGVLAGAGELEIHSSTGFGVLNLTATNTYSGGTVINSGATVAISKDSNLGAVSGGLTLNNGTLRLNTGVNTSRLITLSGTYGGIDVFGNTNTFSGVIGGYGWLTVSSSTGSGTLNLTNTNTYAGGTIINSGATVGISDDSNLGDAGGSLTFNGGTLQFTTNITSSRAVVLGAGGGTINGGGGGGDFYSTGTFSGSGNLNLVGGGAGGNYFNLTNIHNSYTGNTSVSGNAVLYLDDDRELGGSTQIIVDNAYIFTTNNITTYRTVTLNAGGGGINNLGKNNYFNGVVSGVGALTLYDGGFDHLTNTNTYQGGTNINQGSTAVVMNDNNLGAASGTLSFDNGTLQTASGISSARKVTLNAGGGTINAYGNSSTFSGVISGTGALTVTSGTGSGVLTLTAANTYSGGTTINSGATVAISTNNNLGTGGLTLNGGALKTLSYISRSGTVSLGASGGTIDTFGNTSTFSGMVSGTGALTVSSSTGSGVLLLTSTNSYGGGTTISSGATVAITKAASLGVGSVTLSSGTLNVSADTAISQAIASTGGSYNVLQFTGSNLTLSGALTGSAILDIFDATGTVAMTHNNSGFTGGLSIIGLRTATGVYSGTLSIGSGSNVGSGNIDLRDANLLVTASATVSNTVSLSNNGAAINANGNNLTISGLVSGASLVKNGNGFLTLTHANTYSGGTIINAGTLALSGNGSLYSTGAVVVNSGATFDISGASGTETIGVLSGSGTVVLGGNQLISSSGTDSTFSGSITSSGSFTKAGSSMLTLNGSSSYSGGTTVSTGTLEVGDSNNSSVVLGGNVAVSSSGILRGHGTIGGNVTNSGGGTVAPGGSIGTLTISGNYIQGSGSTLSIELSPSQTSKLVISGTATLGGTLSVTPDAGTYTRGTQYIILTATGGVSGTFSTLIDTATSVAKFTVKYNSNNVVLSAGGLTTFNTAAITTNQHHIGAMLDGLSTVVTTGAFSDLIDSVDALSRANQPAALDQLTSAVGADLALAGAQNLRLLMGSVQSHLAGSGGTIDADINLDPTAKAKPSLKAWMQGLGNFTNLASSDVSPGMNSNTGGTAVGLENQIDAHTRFGVVFGAAINNLSVNNVNQSGKLSSYGFGFYGNNRYADDSWLGGVVVNGAVMFGYNEATTKRTIDTLGQTAEGSAEGYGIGTNVGASYPVALDNDTTLTPSLGMAYTRNYQDAYTESGTTGANLTVNSLQQDMLQSSVGITLGTRFTLSDDDVTIDKSDKVIANQLFPELHAGWLHEVIAPRNSAVESFNGVTGSSFTTFGAAPDRNAAALGIGLSYVPADLPELSVYGRYDATLAAKESAHQVTAGFRYSW